MRRSLTNPPSSLYYFWRMTRRTKSSKVAGSGEVKRITGNLTALALLTLREGAEMKTAPHCAYKVFNS